MPFVCLLQWHYQFGLLEVICGITILIGVLTRIAAILFIIEIIGPAILIIPKGFVGGYDLPLLALSISVSLVLTGPGKVFLEWDILKREIFLKGKQIVMRNHHQIRGHIYPGQGIVLYFSLNVLPTTKVQLPVLGPLALHFLRSDQRSILDSLSDQSNFARAFSFTNTTFFDPITFHSNFDFARSYYEQFGRFIPFDFVNQVIPIIFKVTGKEVIDVVTLPPGKVSPVTSVKNISTQILKIPAGVTTKVRLALRYTGDVAVVPGPIPFISPGLQSALGINGVNPSAIASPNIPQTLFFTIIPVGVVGPSTIPPGPYYKAPLPANTSYEFEVNVFPTHYMAGTVVILNLLVTWNNIVGEERSQMNQVYFEVTP